MNLWTKLSDEKWTQRFTLKVLVTIGGQKGTVVSKLLISSLLPLNIQIVVSAEPKTEYDTDQAAEIDCAILHFLSKSCTIQMTHTKKATNC
jgi:hypothetical protein